MTVQDALLANLDPLTLYGILRLRAEVFVVEQDCVYLDMDGRDAEPTARQVWITEGDEVVATLRLLQDPDGALRIGRVATAMSTRGRGLAADLMQRALELAETRDIVLEAQTHLTQWYRRFGFEVSGSDYVEDGIPHTPMRRAVG